MSNKLHEAIVRAALERAAEQWLECRVEWGHALAALEVMSDRILALASDPAEVAAIIKKAGEDRG
jgi:hypothetical protein